MSPVRRGRKGKQNKKSTRRPALPDVLSTVDECDCPACSGADFDPQRLIDELIAGAADLVESEDPLDAEIAGATFVSIGAVAGKEFEEALVGGFIPEFEARASSEALVMLLAIGSVAPGRAGKAAWAAADRLVEAGVARPGWAAELGEAVTVGDCRRLSDLQGTASMLACSFHRAGRTHAVVMSVDHDDCGAAGDILLLDVDQLPEALEMIRAGGRDSGFEITTETLDAAEFRWQVEKALDARAVHDSDLPDEDMSDLPVDEDGPGYPALAVLVRARMNALPAPSKPAAPHGDEGAGQVGLAALQMLVQFAGNAGSPFGAGTPIALRGRTAVPALPAKRAKSDRPAPVYRLKVGLRGAKPPIWRRLEVPADISLARLHTVIQIAFGWHDSHLHVFETPYGNFGTADPDLGHRAEEPVTLEQVAPAVNNKLRYTYDFGDDWEHDILVEKTLDRDETATYPRCTGGRRAAPPEDCGGTWGYADLVEVLNDPADPEHHDRLEWLGLDHAADFDPDRFDAETVTQALSRLA
jgi:Plasmid pRiA4b ORF-3-like protein